MKRLAAVALREVAERRFVLVAAAAAAVLPFLAPFLPGVPAGDGPAVRSIVALVLSCAFGLGGSLLVGASVVGRELAERRLSFHFARPVSAPVVWGGKLLGGLALVLLAELVVLVPTSVSSGAFPGLPGISLDTRVLWAILLLAVPFFLLAWVGSVALRSRSPWLVVDLVLLVTVPALFFVIVRRLLRYGHAPEPSWAIAAVAVLLLALLAATLAQVVAGRTDPRRGHGAQSLTLWSVLLVATAAAALGAERRIDPGISRLVRAWAGPADASGEVVFVEGSVKADGGDGVLYVRDLKDGKERALPTGWEFAASADGSRVAIVHGREFSRSAEAEVIDVRTGRSVALDLQEWPDGLALSSDGGRLATVAGGICSVVEVPSLRLLASARVPSNPGWVQAPRFISDDRVRLHPLRRSYRKREEKEAAGRAVTDPEAAELDVRARTMTALARYPVSAIPYRSVKPAQGLPTEPYFGLQLSPDLSRVLVVAWGAARSVRLLDATTGAVLGSFDGAEDAGLPTAAFLADGRAAVVGWGPNGRTLVVCSPSGARLSEVPLAAARDKWVWLGEEVSPGLVAVGFRPKNEQEGAEADWFLADLASGRSRAVPVQLIPRTSWRGLGLGLVPPPGSPATRLAWEKGTGRLVLFDPATGATKPLTRGKAAGK